MKSYLNILKIGFVSMPFFLPQLIYSQTNKSNYFQQEVNHKIEVTLDDESHFLRGKSEIEYVNNSPDTLHFIYFHLWPNAYSSDRTAYNKQAVENNSKEFYLAPKTDWGYIDSLSFSVDLQPSAIVPTAHRDVVKLMLNDPLLPQEKVTITTPFRVQIPTTFSRLGHHEQSYQITQWYPKPAVYDQKGWHPMPYLDQGEFYSEFGRFDVSITLPKNYIVMATGELKTPSEIDFLNNLSTKKVENIKVETPESSKELKTIRYTEENIHDFAWFADKTWAVKKDIITLPKSGRKVESWVAYFPHHHYGWSNSLKYLEEGILGYSEKVGEYPYSTVKAVEGPLIAGGGMEYPTITIIIPSDDSEMVKTVIIHEVGHNWFYGILANNERDEPWMDESINSYYEQEIIGSEKNIISSIEKLAWLYNSNRYMSQPLAAPSESFTYFNYGGDVYKRGAQAFKWLNAYIGDAAFNSAIHSFYEDYKFKHFNADDLHSTFKKHTDKNVDWFFKDYALSERPIDFKIKSINKIDDSIEVVIKNKTHVNVPAILDVIWKDENDKDVLYRYTTEPFVENTTKVISLEGHKLHSIQISETIPDVQQHNNYYLNGSLSRWKVAPFAGFNANQFKKIYVAPSLGYNRNNAFMLGLLLHNITIPSHKFQFALAPMYSFKDKNVYGTGFLNYTHYTPNTTWLHSLDLKTEIKSFGWRTTDLNINNPLTARYLKIAPEVTLNFRKPYPRSSIKQELSAKAYFIQEQNMDFELNPSDSLYIPKLNGYQGNFYGQLKYSLVDDRTFNPYSLQMKSEFHESFLKLSLEAQLRVDYHYKNSGLDIRAFVGKMFIANTENNYDHYRYRFSGTYTQENDYLYDNTYIARSFNDGFGSKQISIEDGGMKIPTLMYAQPLGMTDNMLTSINLSSDIPIKNLPIKVFFDLMTYSNAKKINPSGNAFLWDAGFELDLWGVGSIYFPIAYSNDYKEYLNSMYPKNKFFKTISFKLNLNNIKWNKPLETIPFLKSQF